MAEEKTLLVVDDEASICTAFARFFSKRRWQVLKASTIAAAQEIALREQPKVVFLDVRLPDGSGLDLLDQWADEMPESAVVMITAYGDMETVLRAMRGKAFDYLPKPIDMDRALKMASRALASLEPGEARRDPADAPGADSLLVGSSGAMQEVYKRIARLSVSDCSVLIEGQTGTGKELAARAIHAHSPRSEGPFEAVNCGALPVSLVESELFGRSRGSFTGAAGDAPGKFEAAQGGTLLLDEIGELPPEAQVKLLRVLDTHTIQRVGSTRNIQLDVRVLAATNRDLETFVSQGKFRRDLYYRLAVGRLVMPALGLREGDIDELAQHFLAQLPQPMRLSPSAAEILRECDWPGNVRQLRNVLQQAAALAAGDEIHPEDLSDLSRGQGEDPKQDAAEAYVASIAQEPGDLYRAAVEGVERAVISKAMRQCEGNQTDAARLLGLHRNTLRKKLRSLGIGD